MRRTEWTTRCYEILDSVRADGVSQRLSDEWAALYASFLAAETQGPGNPRSAGLVCFTGHVIATASGDHAAAANYLHAYFRNPGLDSDDKATRLSHRCLLAGSLHLAGRELDAIALYRDLHASTPRSQIKTLVAHCRDNLIRFCETQDPHTAASEPLALLAAEAASHLRRKKNAGRILPGESTHGLLLEVLRSTR